MPSSPRRRAGAQPQDAATPPARRPGAPPRAKAKPAAPRLLVARRAAGTGASRWRGRALGVAALVGSVLVGLPVAHAILGELGALALALGLGAFALGRATSRRRA